VQDLQIDKDYLPNGVVLLRVGGKVNSVTAGQFGWMFWGLFAQNSYRIILDASALASVDSTGIGILINATDTARENSGNVIVVNPSARVKWAMDTLCVAPLFTLADSREAAEKTWAEGNPGDA
jgi:anti-anti-sigma factor